MTTYILIRHGETSWNKDERLMGTTDVPLTKKGIEQAHKLGKYLSKIHIDKIYTSPLVRTLKTAKTIKRYHKKTPLISSDLLLERSFGNLEGWNYGDVNNSFPTLVYTETWKYEYFQPPGGERIIEVQDRVKLFLKEIESFNNHTIAIVSHGVFIKIMFATLLSIPLPSLSSYRIDNTSLTILTKNNEGKVSVQRINVVDHLDTMTSHNPW
ncbi:histidine phosphatase family protein [Candidatus Gottesmanbacteria bacterium]|nr:histidine phosphatase family protein [Candidatus Gottesmanbacteria bacterium]